MQKRLYQDNTTNFSLKATDA